MGKRGRERRGERKRGGRCGGRGEERIKRKKGIGRREKERGKELTGEHFVSWAISFTVARMVCKGEISYKITERETLRPIDPQIMADPFLTSVVGLRRRRCLL